MLDKVLAFWRGHGTKIIGFAQGTIAAVVSVTGIIPDAHMKYYMLAIGVLTFWRGFSNSAASPQP